MESFLDDMDKREGKDNENEEDVDYFQDLPSDEEDELSLEPKILSQKKKKISAKSSRNLKYKDYFDPVEGEMVKADDDEDQDGEDDDFEDDEDGEFESDEQRRKMMRDDESEGEDMEEIFGGKSAKSDQNHHLKKDKRRYCNSCND
ncbi:hypothetical protein WMY93_013443 [Mugilogobius chulae]|uniref:Spt6 acidic N-terminal domain-containing protein n=1 Tax=Mugilogobius chulae TaxID=88201 RepID=A0AAW0P951_9GOBI